MMKQKQLSYGDLKPSNQRKCLNIILHVDSFPHAVKYRSELIESSHLLES